MLPSGLPEIIADEEDLARFLTSRGHFNATMVKAAAFLPNPIDHKKSVCRHGRTSVDDFRRLASEYLSAEMHIYGVGVCKASDVRSLTLDVIAEEPPPRHANIIGWPINEADPDLQKAAQKELAGFLASKCGDPVMFSR